MLLNYKEVQYRTVQVTKEKSYKMEKGNNVTKNFFWRKCTSKDFLEGHLKAHYQHTIVSQERGMP